MKENRGIILHVCMQGYKNVEQEELSQFLIEFAKARPNECEAQLINKYFSEGNLVKDSKDYQKIAEISQRC